jgi:hypothetical protein
MRNIIGLLLVLVFLSACSREILSEKHPHSDLLASSKQHYLFQKGSYWIYRDSITGRVDSCYVYYVKLDTINSNGLMVENIDVKMKQYPIINPKEDSVFYEISVSAGNQYNAYKGDQFYFTGDKRYLSYSNGLYFFGTHLPLSPDSSFSTEFGYTAPVKVQLNKEFLLSGNIFSNVFEIQTNQSPTGNKGRTIYFNEAHGLVKMRIRTEDFYYDIKDKVWELQRWKVIK